MAEHVTRLLAAIVHPTLLRVSISMERGNATTIASSSGVGTVDRTSFGPIGASLIVVRLRHFWMVVGLTP